MKLPLAPPVYDLTDQNMMRRELETRDVANFKKGEDVRFQRGERVVLVSPNGSLFYLKVDNAGVLTTAAYP